MNIYDLNANWLRLDAALDESGGDLTPELENMLQELLVEGTQALEQAGLYRQHLQSQQTVIKERRAALAAKRDQLERQLEALDRALVPVLERLGKAQRFPEFTLGTQTRTHHAYALAPGVEYWHQDVAPFVKTEFSLRSRDLDLARKEGNLPEAITVVSTTTTGVMQRKPTAKKADGDVCE